MRLGGLAQQQRDQDRLAHRGDHLVGERLGQFQFGGGEVHRLLGPAELDQGHHGVQPVGRLVGLGAQRLREAPLVVQLAGQRLQLRVVAQGDHGAAAAAAGDRRAVDHQDPVRRQVHLVHPGPVGEQHTGEGSRQPEVGCPGSGDVHRQAQQLAAGVVDQGDPALPVEHEQALAHPVQGRLVVVVHPAELGRVHAMSVAAQPCVDDVRARTAQGERASRDPDERGELRAEPVADGADGDPRADQADDPAAVLQRGDHADGGAEGAGVGLAEGLAAQGRGGVAQERLADPARVGVGPAPAVRGHDRHEVDPGVHADLLRVGLELEGRVVPARRSPYGLAYGG